VTGGWRKLHNEELLNLYSSIIRMIKSRRMRLAGHVASAGEKRNANKILVGKLKERDRQEDQDLGGYIILKWISDRWDAVVWTGLIWLRMGTSGGLL
jgi:hypothetical protein